MSEGENASKIPALSELFAQLNREHFDEFLDAPELRWNSRLRSSAGRFIPGARRLWQTRRPVIEIASYLMEESNALGLVLDTMGHEMIHYWLWIRHRPYGHTAEFHAKMKQMGVSRYNTVPRNRPYKYVYRCAGCRRDFPAKRRLGVLACARCCQEHNDGRYDSRFKLVLHRELEPSEGIQLPLQGV
ncbi:MAG: SprT-like domain-containing protein [Bdellovibrionota bacterium]